MPPPAREPALRPTAGVRLRPRRPPRRLRRQAPGPRTRKLRPRPSPCFRFHFRALRGSPSLALLRLRSAVSLRIPHEVSRSEAGNVQGRPAYRGRNAAPAARSAGRPHRAPSPVPGDGGSSPRRMRTPAVREDERRGRSSPSASHPALSAPLHPSGAPFPSRPPELRAIRRRPPTGPIPSPRRAASAAGGGSIARRSDASMAGRSAETTSIASPPLRRTSRAARASAWLSPVGRGSSSPAAPQSPARARARGSGLTTRTGNPAAAAVFQGVHEHPPHERGSIASAENRCETPLSVGQRTDGNDDPARSIHGPMTRVHAL